MTRSCASHFHTLLESSNDSTSSATLGTLGKRSAKTPAVSARHAITAMASQALDTHHAQTVAHHHSAFLCSAKALQQGEIDGQSLHPVASGTRKAVVSSFLDWITTPSGLKYADHAQGSGQEAAPGHRVSVHYTGKLEDGTVFDSSRTRGTPLSFELGAGNVIKGWEEGIKGMKVGGKRQLHIPANLAYGSQGAGPIPPDATLTFDTELVNIG
eukprot:TRINITY_DN15948_c0_g1_i1.p1 TRINITY_DN15948_c0_g1~~TRINITY_DN15948_c0_g1_i1.p1  ORF type:complete len:230 (+),score=36.60 TRINITY_DN15948_c0_g1_i1:53-691(+)